LFYGNEMQVALRKAGLGTVPKPRKIKHKKFNCHTCGNPMQIIENTNVMVCTNEKCSQYFVFDNAN